MINNKQKQWIYILLLLIASFAVIMQYDYREFLNHSIAKTDFDWKKNETVCIKEILPEDSLIPFWIFSDGKVKNAEPFTHYTYQYMFAPVIFYRKTNPQPQEVGQFILKLGDSSLHDAQVFFSDFESHACSDELILFTRKEQP